MPVAPGQTSLGSAQSESGPLRVHNGSAVGSFSPSDYCFMNVERPPFPTAEQVEEADHETLCYWFQYLPGDGGDDAKWAIIQHINRRIAANWSDASERYKTRRAKPKQAASTPAKPKAPKTPAAAPKAPENDASRAAYFKSLFSDLGR